MDAAAVASGAILPFRWSTGNTARIQPGDRLFFLKQGKGVRGIFAAGVATSSAFKGDHFDETRARTGDQAWYVEGLFDGLLDPDFEPILTKELLEAKIPDSYWNPAASGFSVPDDSAKWLEILWHRHLTQARPGASEKRLFPDEVEQPRQYIEGATRTVIVNALERSSSARAKCIAHYGSKCQVCDFDFEQTYGSIGKGFIHVHHLRPLSALGHKYIVDPIRDLRPVCPNCHAMLHQKDPPFAVEQLRNRLIRTDGGTGDRQRKA